MIDLGAWAAESYRVPTDDQEPQQQEPQEQEPSSTPPGS
jgi:endogenous inhibitor of DNA gyrase (YacG/DUF329 family)